MPYPLFCLFCSYYFCSFSFLLSWGCNFLVVSSTLKMEHRPPISIPLQQLCSQCFRYVLPIFMLSHDINIYYGHQGGSYRILFWGKILIENFKNGQLNPKNYIFPFYQANCFVFGGGFIVLPPPLAPSSWANLYTTRT